MTLTNYLIHVVVSCVFRIIQVLMIQRYKFCQDYWPSPVCDSDSEGALTRRVEEKHSRPTFIYASVFILGLLIIIFVILPIPKSILNIVTIFLGFFTIFFLVNFFFRSPLLLSHYIQGGRRWS